MVTIREAESMSSSNHSSLDSTSYAEHIFVQSFANFCLHILMLRRYDPTTGAPSLSESAILEYARQLSEDIGYRTVGTREHALADQWMVNIAHKLKDLCDKTNKTLECEVWHQTGSGSHRWVYHFSPPRCNPNESVL
jgi:hypothetical protein